jgi:hypothetical protein
VTKKKTKGQTQKNILGTFEGNLGKGEKQNGK